MRARSLRFVPALALALLAACDDPTQAVCPAVVVPSLEVTVVDDATGTDLTQTARGWWITGDASDALLRTGPGNPLQAYGPAGRYALIVQHDGYRTWGRDDIRVIAGECGPRTVEILARLTPAGGIRASSSPAD